MTKRLVGIRGATCCDNTKEEITEYVCQMCNKIMDENNLTPEDLVSVQFTVTKDITAMNPATALRKGPMKYDMSEVALFCSQEADIEGGLEYVVRVLVHAYMPEFSTKHNVYINGGERLRPDFYKK